MGIGTQTCVPGSEDARHHKLAETPQSMVTVMNCRRLRETSMRMKNSWTLTHSGLSLQESDQVLMVRLYERFPHGLGSGQGEETVPISSAQNSSCLQGEAIFQSAILETYPS